MTRLLVMGAGLIGLRHINAIRANPDCVLAGVTEPNSDLHTNPETGCLPSICRKKEPVSGLLTQTKGHHQASKRGNKDGQKRQPVGGGGVAGRARFS